MSKKEHRCHRSALYNFLKMCMYAGIWSRIQIKWTSTNKREWTTRFNQCKWCC